MNNEVAYEFCTLIEAAKRISSDTGEIVEEILAVGTREPLSPGEVRSVLTKVIEAIRADAKKRGDDSALASLGRDTDSFIEQVISAREKLVGEPSNSEKVAIGLDLQDYKGIKPRPVKPSPVFYEREIPVMEGFVRTKDIKVWDGNERIQIHLNQFSQVSKRAPTTDELLDIMHGKLKLPGISSDDQFKIKELAKSIAINGVRKHPIIDVDGTLLDGNRRVSACYYILDNPDFNSDEKNRAKYIPVWQLTEHATDADREAVIVSLNFESDYKVEWPAYVKAHKVYDQWQSMLTLESRVAQNRARQNEIKRTIARRLALSLDEVNRYIKMVELAEEFEDYHVSERNQDKYAAKHHAEKYFQYFDELGKGKNAGGVLWSLNQSETFKNLVYDLLYDGKFKNWNKIRDLRYVYQNEDAVTYLKRARDETDIDTAREHVDDGCSLARSSRAEQRQVGANTRVKVFVDWFKDLPVKTFREGEPGAITRDNLRGLSSVLQLVERHLNGADENLDDPE